MHKVFPGKGRESIALSNSSKILQKSNCKNRNLSKVIRGEFQFHLQFQLQFQSHAGKKFT